MRHGLTIKRNHPPGRPFELLPEMVATRCNPGNPQMAFAVLKSECTYILCNAAEAYAAWSKVGPHTSTATDAE